jgi:hypothetical protein
MPRKTPSTAPSVPQAGTEGETPGLESQLAALDRYDAQQRDEEADDLDHLRQRWAPALTQAQTILADLSGLQATYGPALEALEKRDFSSLPPTARILNAVAGVERTCQELGHSLNHTMEDLRRIINAVEKLSPRTVALLQANASTYREQLAFYRHTPQGVRDLFRRLERLVASLTEGLEVVDDADVYTPVRRLPAPQPMTPEVEMA